MMGFLTLALMLVYNLLSLFLQVVRMLAENLGIFSLSKGNPSIDEIKQVAKKVIKKTIKTQEVEPLIRWATDVERLKNERLANRQKYRPEIDDIIEL